MGDGRRKAKKKKRECARSPEYRNGKTLRMRRKGILSGRVRKEARKE